MKLKFIEIGFTGLLFLISTCLLVSANSDCPEDKRVCVGWTIRTACEDIEDKECLKLDAEETGISEEEESKTICEKFPDEHCLEITFKGTVMSIIKHMGCPFTCPTKEECIEWSCEYDYPGDTLCIKWKGESDTQCSSASKNFDINKYREELERCYFVNCVEDDIFGLDCEEINCFDDMPGKEEEEEVIIIEPTEEEAEEEGEIIVAEPTEEIPCSHCPSGCELDYSIDKDCGECICPPNYGFCQQLGLRNVINETPVFCIDELWFAQKKDNQLCQNSFECVSNFCSKGVCYDISSQVEENKSILQSILDWIRRLFHI